MTKKNGDTGPKWVKFNDLNNFETNDEMYGLYQRNKPTCMAAESQKISFNIYGI